MLHGINFGEAYPTYWQLSIHKNERNNYNPRFENQGEIQLMTAFWAGQGSAFALTAGTSSLRSVAWLRRHSCTPAHRIDLANPLYKPRPVPQ
jgi:hypothetical protein